jgi:hypothetical protein
VLICVDWCSVHYHCPIRRVTGQVDLDGFTCPASSLITHRIPQLVGKPPTQDDCLAASEGSDS